MKTLSTLRLENPILSLPAIKIQQQINDQPRPVTQFHFCRSQPKVRHNPQLFGLSQNALHLLGLSPEPTEADPDTPLFLSGSKLLQDSHPLAHNYSGYQFGSWAGQLGDGRAHILGSLRNGKQLYELQLKGSGLTPFSRHADGNSVVSSAVREFLASELMAGLGVPTTRAASLVIADEPVRRDPFYNGNIKIEKAAIVLRVCQTFLRFGSLEVCLKDGQMNQANMLENRKILEPLCTYAIKQHFPLIDWEQSDPYEQLYKSLVQKSAELVAQWQSMGFCHGVLNTDNMSLGGVTIDYGPFAFIDYFSKDYVSNASDEHERYSYRRQPAIVEWNLQKLAEALDPLFPYSIAYKHLQNHFQAVYQAKYYSNMADKLGVNNEAAARGLVDQLMENMHVCGTHFTNLFRIIEENGNLDISSSEMTQLIVGQSQPTEFYLKTLRAFPQLLGVSHEPILKSDPAFNTLFIEEQRPRLAMRERLTVQTCQERHKRETVLWTTWVEQYYTLRGSSKQKPIRNPKYVLLNHIAKQITQQLQTLPAAEARQLLHRVLGVLSNPYEKDEWFEQTFWKTAPLPVKLTCSS